MKKSLLLILVLFIGLFSFASPALATEYAFSVGSKYASGVEHAGDDFTANVLEAANAYGWLKNYSSFYNLKPDYSYINSYLNYSVFFINGHANPNYIDVAGLNSTNYKTGITTYGNGTTTLDGFIYAGLNGRNMNNTKLITFAGCKTGAGNANLVTKAVAQGAKAAVGFTDDISSRVPAGFKWLQKYNYVLGSGYSVSQAIASANIVSPESNLKKNVIVRGNGSQVLGILDNKSSIGANNDSLLFAKDVDTFKKMTKPIEEEYKIIYNGMSERNYKIDSQDIIDFIVEKIKVQDASFDISDYKVEYNMVNEDDGFGFVFLTYYIDNQIETNKVYMATMDDNKIASITLAGVLKSNIIYTKLGNIYKNSLKQKVQLFEDNKVSKLKQNDKRNLFSSNFSKELNKAAFIKKVDNFSERYYYDYNVGKLYYQLTTFEVDQRGLTDGYELQIELA